MPESDKSLELRLHSPAGLGPINFPWPLATAGGTVSLCAFACVCVRVCVFLMVYVRVYMFLVEGI